MNIRLSSEKSVLIIKILYCKILNSTFFSLLTHIRLKYFKDLKSAIFINLFVIFACFFAMRCKLIEWIYDTIMQIYCLNTSYTLLNMLKHALILEIVSI